MEVDDSSIKLTTHRNGVKKTGENKSNDDSNESTGELDVSKETDVQNGSFDDKDDTSVKDVDSCSEKETEEKTFIATVKVPEKETDENLNNDKWKLRLDLSDSCSVTENEGTDAEDSLDMKSSSKQLVGKLPHQDGDEPEERDGFLGYEAPLCTPEAITIMSKLVAKYEREIEGEEKIEIDNLPDDLETSSLDLKLYQGKEDSAPEVSLSSNGSSPTTDTSKSSRKGKGTAGIRSGTKKNFLNLSDPAFKKPFEMGWKRELVYRNTADVHVKRMADIYYFTPSGKKVRSIREVMEFLTGTDLTIDNFTFFKEPLGINDPDKEIIRDAKRVSIAGSQGLNLTPGRKNSKGKMTPNSPDSASSVTETSIKTDVVDEEDDDEEEKAESEMAKSKSPQVVKLARTFPRIKVTPTRLQRTKSQSALRNKSGSVVDSNVEMVLPSMWKDKDGDSDSKVLSSTGTKATSLTQKATTTVKQASMLKVAPSVKPGPNTVKQKVSGAGNISPGMKSGQATKVALPSNIQTTWPQANSTPKLAQHKKFEPCSIRCAGMMGVIPSLQCRLCLCLYHTQCVGLGSISGPIHSYICKNCQQVKDIAKVTTNSIITTTPPPLKPISSMGAGSQTISGSSESNNNNDDNSNSIDNGNTATDTSPITPSSSPPKLQRFPRQQGEPSSSKVVMVPRYVKVSPTEQKQLVTVAQTTAASTVTTTRSMSTVCSLTTWVPPSSIQVSGGGTLLPMPSISPAATPLTGSSPPPPPPNQALAQVMGKKYIVLPRHGSIALHTPIPTDRPSVPPDNMPKSAATFIISGQNPPGVLLVPVLGAGATGNASAPEKQQYFLVNGTSSGIENTANNLLTAPSVKESDENRKRKADDETKVDLTPSDSSKRARISYGDSSLHHFMQDFMTHLSCGYSAMLHVFGYLKVQELLRAGRVCRLWQSLANHPSLWRTVRMKNSPVVDWKGCATALQERGTRHLDLRKMLVPARAEEWWNAFCSSIGSVQSLETIELCRCPAIVVERLALQCPQLRSICALSIKCQSINLSCMSQLKYLQELRIKSLSGMYLDGNLEAFKELTCLKHLSLTMVKNLGQTGPGVLGSLKQLESLELGECSDMPQAFGTQALSQLQSLQRLRLEKGQGEDCPTTSLLAGVRLLSSLTTLELVNFDIKPGFDAALARCKNIKRLLIIPTYISQSATTNHMVLGGITQLSHSLTHFVWGVTHELLRVTELFVDQCEDQKTAPSGTSKPKKGSVAGGGSASDSIPVLRPVPGAEDMSNGEEGNAPSSEEAGSQSQSGAPQVDILPLVKLQKLLNHTLPQTRVKILKVPFQATWRQYISETDF